MEGGEAKRTKASRMLIFTCSDFQLQLFTLEVWGKRGKKIQKNGSKEQETVQTFEYKYIYKYIDKPMNIVYIFFGLLCFPPVYRFAYFIGLLLLSTRTGLKMIL